MILENYGRKGTRNFLFFGDIRKIILIPMTELMRLAPGGRSKTSRNIVVKMFEKFLGLTSTPNNNPRDHDKCIQDACPSGIPRSDACQDPLKYQY
jgi:hypothetical protein